MSLKFDDIEFNIEYDAENLHSKTPILFLHGFTGNLNDWKFVENKIPNVFTPLFIDLIGHGKTSSPENMDLYSSSSQVQYLKKIIDKLKLNEIIICGYSMGGRLALDFAHEFPNYVNALILESTSFGIKDENESVERIDNDIRIAEKLNEMPLNEFLDFWFELPLFQSLKKLSEGKLNQIKNERINSNNKIGLQNSLIGFSTGKMKNYFLFANNIKMKVLLITGDLDLKFTEIARTVLPVLQNGNLEIIHDAGHNTHLEKPEEFLKLINKFLQNILENK